MKTAHAPFQFTTRHLLFITAATGGLLVYWKSYGWISAGVLMLTLIWGTIFQQFLRQHQIRERKWMFCWCSVMTIASAILFPMSIVPWRNRINAGGCGTIERADFLPLVGLELLSLLTATTLIVSLILLAIHAISPILSIMFVLVNLGVLWTFLRDVEILSTWQPDLQVLKEGFSLAFLVLAAPWILSRVNKLPTTREEIEEFQQEESS